MVVEGVCFVSSRWGYQVVCVFTGGSTILMNCPLRVNMAIWIVECINCFHVLTCGLLRPQQLFIGTLTWDFPVEFPWSILWLLPFSFFPPSCPITLKMCSVINGCMTFSTGIVGEVNLSITCSVPSGSFVHTALVLGDQIIAMWEQITLAWWLLILEFLFGNNWLVPVAVVIFVVHRQIENNY